MWPFSIWTKQRKSDDEFDASRVAEAKRIILLMQGGWRSCERNPPIGLGDVMFTRNGETTFIHEWEFLPPEYNIAGLWWRPLRADLELS